MKTTILHMLCILVLYLNPCSFLSCWLCNPPDENQYDLECLQESAQVPTDPIETTTLPNGLSKEECPISKDACVSFTASISHQGKLRNITRRCCGVWNSGMMKLYGTGSSGTKCLEIDISDKMPTMIGEAEWCFCTTDLCNGNTNISNIEKQQMKINVNKLEELEREAKTLEKGINEIKETIQELRDAA